MTRSSPLHPVLDARLPRGLGGTFYGAWAAVVTDVVDPEGQGRVRVRLPWSPDSGDDAYEAWARLATLMAGGGRGTWFVPDAGDEVLVLFEGGNPRRPYVVGALWNGADAPPESMDSRGENHVKTVRSRSGVVVTLDDSPGRETLHLATPGGQEVTLRDGPATIEIRDAAGNTVTLDSSGVRVSSPAKVSVQASTLEVSAGLVKVDAGMSRFSGVVQADTVISNSVVSASYSPGAGNIW